MLFSILVPVYNAEKYINECLDSLVLQSFDGYEIILIDDGSTDRSGDICESYKAKYPERIRIKHKENEGLLLARRDAISMAKGDYIVFCDSDDILDKNCLDILAAIIYEKEPDIIQYDLYVFNDINYPRNINGNKCFVPANQLNEDVDILRERLLLRDYNIWSLAGKCVKRSCIGITTDYRAYKKIKYGEDTLQSVEIYTRAHNFVYCPEKLYYYRASSGMTKKLGIEYCENFFEIGRVITLANEKWKMEHFLDALSVYYCSIIHFLIINLVSQKSTYRKTKELFDSINRQTDFRAIYIENRNNDMYRNRFKKRYILFDLLYYKHYGILYFLIIVKRFSLH